MLESKKPIIIPPEIERQFHNLVEISMDSSPFLSTKPLKYKIGSKVWIPKLGDRSIEILKGIANVYLVRTTRGEYHICDEEDIETVN